MDKQEFIKYLITSIKEGSSEFGSELLNLCLTDERFKSFELHEKIVKIVDKEINRLRKELNYHESELKKSHGKSIQPNGKDSGKRTRKARSSKASA